MKENGKMIKYMVKESLFIQMVMNMKVNGKMVNGMEMESVLM